VSAISVLVAEDEKPQRETLVQLLAELWPAARVVASCADGLEALEAAKLLEPEVAFLDIRMPGLSGIEVAKQLAPRAHIAFVTAYDHYAVTAFEQGAVDYLLKPVRRERLVETVQRLERRVRERPPVLEHVLAQLQRSFESTAKRDSLKWITASVGDTVRLYPIEEVVAFQAQDKYTRVLTTRDEAIIRTSLRELTQALDAEAFWQVHRSVIVRALAIDSVRRDELGKHWLALKGRSEILPVSTGFYARFRAM
jgi:DNA-binding LytR/AlgR family response regulator